MDAVLELPAWVTAILLAAGMVIACEVGFRFSRATRDRGTRVDDATLALLGLLLAFTFANATDKHEQRKWEVVSEATAIGDFWAAGRTLEEPDRSALGERVRTYVDLRIKLSERTYDDPDRAALVARTREAQSCAGEIVERAVRGGNTPAVHNELVVTWVAMTTALARRLAASLDHVPEPVLLLLVTSAVVAAFSLGRIQRASGGRQPFPSAAFIVLVSLIFFVTLDLEQPKRGLVRVWIEPLHSLRDSITAAPPEQERTCYCPPGS